MPRHKMEGLPGEGNRREEVDGGELNYGVMVYTLEKDF
jgi:hypothetical protein